MTFPPPTPLSSSPPQPTWPPPPGWAPPPTRPIRPKRRRFGWFLIIGASLALLVLGATAGRNVFGLMSSGESMTAPGSVTIRCERGDAWRIGPVTGSRRDVGPVAVSIQRESVLGEVSVELDGVDVPVWAMDSGQETFQYGGAIYTALVTFTCPSDGSAVVSLSGPERLQAAVFPSFGRVIRPAVTIVLGGLICIAAGVVGIILAARHRSSLGRSSQPAPPVV